MVSMAKTDGGANCTAATMAETFDHRGDADNGLRLLEAAADVDGRVQKHSGSSCSGDAGGGGVGRNKGSQRRNGSVAGDRCRSRQPDGAAS